MLGEAGEADAHEAQRPGAVVERTIEERARELAREIRRARALASASTSPTMLRWSIS